MIKAEVHLVTSEFVLVLLKGHSVGRIAFLPAKRVSKLSDESSSSLLDLVSWIVEMEVSVL